MPYIMFRHVLKINICQSRAQKIIMLVAVFLLVCKVIKCSYRAIHLIDMCQESQSSL